MTLTRTILSATLASVFLTSTVLASSSSAVIPKLEPEKQHAKAAKRVVGTYLRNHYKSFKLNDAFSEKVFQRYLRNLDYNKNFFLAADVAKFSSYANKFDEALTTGDMYPAYLIYQQLLVRRVERLNYALSLLDNDFDFARKNDKFYYDREDAEWAVNTAELDEVWRQRVKYDLLNLVLADKTEAEAKKVLQKRYTRSLKRLEQIKSEDVFQTFMNAFSRSLEAHTSYLSPRNAERFQMQMNLSFEGIGASLQTEDDYTVVKGIIAGGPADKSGKLKPEDKIVGVAQATGDFTDVVGWRLDDVVELIKGPKGSKVRLQILKDTADSKTPIIVEFTRDKVKLEDRQAKLDIYESENLESGTQKLGVIEIPSFYNGLTGHVRELLNEASASNVAGIIVDLRGNGGGSLNESRTLTGLFIDSGPVVQVRAGSGRINIERDMDGIIHYSGPLTVMVDRYSASASEIFAAAIQDYNRGIVIGEQTFGKGTVQRHKGLGRYYDMQENPLGSIQFTTAKFYRINGSSTQHKGVIPDIAFPSAVEPEEWGESKEENALPYDKINRANYSSFAELSGVIDVLTAKHNKRVLQNPEFAYILSDIDEIVASKNENFISLVAAERKAEEKEAKAERLERTNERLLRLGKPTIKSLDEIEDLPDDLLDIDPFLDEAANITFDLISTGKFASIQ